MRLALVALAACGSPGPALTPEPACPDCGPGEVRFALTGPRTSVGAAALDLRGDGGFAYATDALWPIRSCAFPPNTTAHR